MISLDLLKDLELLEETAKVYIQGKTHYLLEPKAFNFSLLKNVQCSIQSLPLDKDKIEVMERYRNVFTQLANFHPKLVYLYDFNTEIMMYKYLYQQLDSLQQQASILYENYFEVNKPTFDWQGLRELHHQISKVQNTSDRIQLMRAFDEGVLTTISQVRPKTYSELTFQPELEETQKDSSVHLKTQ
ncbi:hypothetical protein [Legionella sp. WA2024007413]